MLCQNCRAEMVREISDYPYKESGLDNVILKGFEIYRCPECGEKYPIISNIESLHQLISKKLVKQDSLLHGKESAFLRKELQLRIDELSRISGFPKEKIEEWEHNNEEVHPAFDKIIRLYFKYSEIDVRNNCKSLLRAERAQSEIGKICSLTLGAYQVLNKVEHHDEKRKIMVPAYVR